MDETVQPTDASDRPLRFRRLRRSGAALAVLTASLVILVATLVKQIPDASITITVDLTVPSPGVTELFVNAESGGTSHPTNAAAGRHTLTFAQLRGPIHTIRIDPVNLAGQRITIHHVLVTGADGLVLADFSGPDFTTWLTFNANDVAVGTDGLALTTTSVDPAVVTTVDIRTGGGRPEFVESMVQWVEQPFLANVVVLGLPTAILGVGLLVRRRWGALLPLAIGPIAVFSGIQLAGSTNGVTPADRAFGQPGWLGKKAQYGQHFLLITSAVVALLCVVVLVIRRDAPNLRVWRASRSTATPPEGEPVGQAEREPALAGEPSSDRDDPKTETDVAEDPAEARDESPPTIAATVRRVIQSRWFATAFVPVVYALIRLPAADQITAALRAPLSPQNWDEANLRAWDHFFASGLRPMRDFWYPYGNLIYLRAGVFGAVLGWAGETLCLVAFSSALWRLSRRTCPVLIGAAAVAAINLQFFTGGFRYLFPLAIVGWFATTRRTEGVERWLALAAVAVAPFIAVDVAVYTLVGVVGVVFVDEMAVRGLDGPAARRRIIRESVAVGLGCIGYVLLGISTGSLRSSLSLVFDQQSTSAYVGAISSVRESIRQTPNLILFVFPFTAIGLGLYASLRQRNRGLGLTWAPALTGLGMYAVLVLAKHLIRPGLDGVLAMICAAGTAVAIASAWTTVRSMTASLAAGALLGGLCVQAQAAHSLAAWRTDLGNAPARAVDLLGAATWNRDDTVVFRAALSPDQMVGLVDEAAAGDAVRQLAPNGRMFVLGDSQFLYPIAGMKPYWIISMWDASPIREQRRVLDELTADPPEVVVVDSRDVSFDGVPSVLRVPLLYRWVVEHYAGRTASGPYELLTPRVSGQQVDWVYWQRVLGTTVDMGRLPAATTAGGATCNLDATTASAHCLAYLSLDVEPTDTPMTRSLTVNGPSGTYALRFVQEPGDRVLRVPLGRLWFWTSASTVSFDDTSWVLNQQMLGAEDSVLY